jgi:endonuclease G
MDSEQMRRARARLTLRRIAPAFLYDPSFQVNMVDYGQPIRTNSADDRPTLRFHVTQKLSPFELERADITPVPRQIGEFTTDVIPGAYRPHLWPWWPAPPAPPPGSAQSRFDTLRGGISISDLGHTSAGTLGGLVRDRATGESLMLSNWHVLVVEWWARPGQRICQPGRLDGGTSADVVAQLVRDAMRDGLDAAVAAIVGDRTLINAQLRLSPVTGVAQSQLGMRVVKSGRTTGVTRGIITGLDGLARLTYSTLPRTIRNVMTIVPLAEGLQVSGPGDSGSWWLETGTNRAVGLHFAGSDWPERALAMNMSPVLDSLGVDVVTDLPAIARRAPARTAALEPV